MRLWLERMVIGFTRQMNLRSKILVMYGLILLAPTLILGSGAIYLVTQSFHNSYLVTIDEAVRQTSRNVDFSKKSYDLLAVRTASDGELVARLGREYRDMTEIVDTVNYVDRTFLTTSKYLPGILDFRIYHTNDTLVQDGQLLWRPEERLVSGMNELDWYNAAVQAPSPLRWSNVPGNSNQLIITRKIISETGNVLGMVYILLNYETIFKELLDHPFNDRGSLFIVDESRHMIAATEEERIGSRMLTREWPEQEGVLESSAVYDLTQSKELMIVKPLSSGWNVVALIHMKYMDTQSRTILFLMVAFTAFFLLLSIFLMMTIVKNIVWRIRRLGNRMSDISRGQFEVTVRHNAEDELGELEGIFNSMSGQLGKLVEDITNAGLMEKEQAFRALQAQINPHFIYNSLGLIRWRALDAEDEEQIRIIDALTTFYRLTLNNQINVTTIRDELEHVRAYLDIQQLRYPNRIQLEWQIDPTVLDCYTIKTILQPIVENSYLHGSITRKKGAVIRISAVREEEHIVLSVYDNGRGIDPAVIEEIEAGTYVGSGNGFGTANIKERLALYFGSEASFTITSVAKEWTLITILFPACLEQPAIRR